MGDFTLATPIPLPSKAKYVVDSLLIRRSGPMVSVEIMVQDSGGTADLERITVNIPTGTATVNGFLGALLSPRSGETGSNGRKVNFRALGYLVDQGLLPPGTLNP